MSNWGIPRSLRMMQGVGAQITRLGGTNCHELRINAPLAAKHNNQRDGTHCHAILRGRMAYEPNTLGGGCPFQAPLFLDRQTAVEHAHIVGGFRLEWSMVTVPGICKRMVSSRRNVFVALARGVADGLGIELLEVHRGAVKSLQGEVFEDDATLENSPAALFDAVMCSDGELALQALAKDGQSLDFMKDQYRHGNAMLVLRRASLMPEKAEMSKTLGSGAMDPRIVTGALDACGATSKALLAAIGNSRHAERECNSCRIGVGWAR